MVVRKILLLLLIIILLPTMSVLADDSNMSKHTSRSRAKNAKYKPPVYQAPADSPESAEIDGLSRDIRQALVLLQTDIGKILGGVEAAAMNECAAQARKQVIELLSVQGVDKKQSVTVLAEDIKSLAKQVEDLSAMYRQKDSEFKALSEKLNELEVRKKGLSEFRSVVKSFKSSEVDNPAIDLSAKSDDLTALNKKIDDVLAETSDTGHETKKAAVAAAKSNDLDKAKIAVAPKMQNTSDIADKVPSWILDKLQSKGRKLETSYGEMVVVKDGASTIISLKKENEAKFRSAYGKFIKESYASDGAEYFVLRD